VIISFILPPKVWPAALYSFGSETVFEHLCGDCPTFLLEIGVVEQRHFPSQANISPAYYSCHTESM